MPWEKVSLSLPKFKHFTTCLNQKSGNFDDKESKWCLSTGMEDFHWHGKSSLWACSDVNANGFTEWPAPDFALLLAAPLLRMSYLESPKTGPMFFMKFSVETWFLETLGRLISSAGKPPRLKDSSRSSIPLSAAGRAPKLTLLTERFFFFQGSWSFHPVFNGV